MAKRNRPTTEDIQTPTDMLNKLAAALVQVSRGDPLIALRNELQTRFDAIDTRFGAIDKATALQHEDMVRVPTLLDKAIGAQSDVLKQTMQTLAEKINGELGAFEAETRQRFDGVASQFAERDTRTDQRAGDTKLAVDAAFAAAKEATAKIEAGFTKQIDAMSDLIDSKTSNLSGSLDDLKGRMTVIESRTSVSDPATHDALSRLTIAVQGLTSTEKRTEGHGIGQREIIAYLLAAGAIAFSYFKH